MVNNVGKTTKSLSTTLGTDTTFTQSDNMTILTGDLGVGCLIFDSIGTVGAVSEYTNNASDYKVKTLALSIDIQTILGASY